jgi:hypothetical protein
MMQLLDMVEKYNSGSKIFLSDVRDMYFQKNAKEGLDLGAACPVKKEGELFTYEVR